MSEFQFYCPLCGGHIQCDTGYSGTQINCPVCQQTISVPQASRVEAAAPAAAKSQTLRNVLVLVAAVMVLAGLVVVGWFGLSIIKMHSGRGLQVFNIDFGPGRTDRSKQVGPAAAGQDGDYWNGVSIGFNNDHTESGLKYANGQPSPIAAELVNLGGGWGNGGKMGVKAPMLDSFNYPMNNRGGNSQVILSHVPPGNYSLYLYGHGTSPLYYGDYAVSVAGHDYGRKQTSSGIDAVENTNWIEGSQYVKFPAVHVAAGENIEILIHPVGQITDNLGRTFADAMICGLQLVPIR
jgi:hypothetical protein